VDLGKNEEGKTGEQQMFRMICDILTIGIDLFLEL
jgi:hypothetical protein